MLGRESLITAVALALAGCTVAERFVDGLHGTPDGGAEDAGVESPSTVAATGCWSPPIMVSPPFWPGFVKWDVGAVPDGLLVAWASDPSRAVVARTVTADAGRGRLQSILEETSDVGTGAVVAVRVTTSGAGARAIGWLWADRSSNYFAFAARSGRPDDTWLPALRFNEDTSREVSHPEVAADSFERLVASWEQRSPAQQSAGVQSRLCDRSGCQPEISLSEPDTILVSPPELSTAGGERLVTWLGYHPPTFEVHAHASILDVGGVWHPATVFPAGDRAVLSSAKSDFAAVVALRDVDGVHASVWDGSWSSSSTLSTGFAAPGLTATFLGLTPAVLSFPIDGGSTYAALSRYEAGAWAAPVVLDAALEGTISAFVGAPSGDGWAMWRGLDGESLTLVRVAATGSVLEKGSVSGLAFGSDIPALNPKLRPDGHGGWWLVGLERDAPGRLVAMHCP